MNDFQGGQIAKRDIKCVKEFNLRRNRAGKEVLWAPHQGTKWGIAKVGRVLRRKALRRRANCARGVHAWRPRTWSAGGFQFAHWGNRVAWHCVIPKGTWYHAGNNKFRADKIRLVKEVKGSRRSNT